MKYLLNQNGTILMILTSNYFGMKIFRKKLRKLFENSETVSVFVAYNMDSGLFEGIVLPTQIVLWLHLYFMV